MNKNFNYIMIHRYLVYNLYTYYITINKTNVLINISVEYFLLSDY